MIQIIPKEKDAMEDIWKRYQNEFNNMTDKEIDDEVRHSENVIEQHEPWLEKVQMWKDAGRPHDGELSNMTDEEINEEVRHSENQMEEHEPWVEAVAVWKQAGKPRS